MSRKNQDLLIALAPHERMLCKSGLPPYLWNPNLANIKFRTTVSRGSKKTGKAQTHWLRTLVEQPPRRRPVIVLASNPTDTGAMYVATLCILNMWNKHKYRAAVLNLANSTKMIEDKSVDQLPRAALLHGIRAKATDQRKEKLNDTLSNLFYAFRIVVVGGCENPEEWMAKEIGVYPDAAFLIEDVHPKDLGDK